MGVCRRAVSLPLLLPVIALAARPASALEPIASFGSNPGELTMAAHLPEGLPAGAPLVVILHGCSQTAADYAAGSGWQTLADTLGFALLAPEQKTSNNANRCFNWFEPDDIARGGGEALSIRQGIDTLLVDQELDPARVFITGLSAGGAMTAVMLAAYPELFAGGAIVAGIPYRCALELLDAWSCMSPGRDRSPDAWGDEVRGATSFAGPWPRVAIWHGDADTTVVPRNADEGVEQWLDVHGLSPAGYEDELLGEVEHRAWPALGAASLVDAYLVPDIGHGVPVDPPGGCGTAGAYVLDAGICHAAVAAALWGLASDGDPPSVSITAPQPNAAVTGVVNVTVAVTTDDTVAEVELLVDASPVASESAAPYELTWDTTLVANGPHALQARATDGHGRRGTSPVVPVTVSGGLTPAPSPACETFTAGYDWPLWSNDGFDLVAANATPGPTSQSAHARVTSGDGCDTTLRRASLTRQVDLAPGARLTYRRQLALDAAVNISSHATFRVLIDGAVVDEQAVTFAELAETSWVDRELELGEHAGTDRQLVFEVEALSTVCIPVTAEVWLDDLCLVSAATADGALPPDGGPSGDSALAPGDLPGGDPTPAPVVEGPAPGCACRTGGAAVPALVLLAGLRRGRRRFA